MPINTQRAETRTITIRTPVADVVRFISDPRNLPRWAPGFARSVRRDGDRWLIETGGGEAEIVPSGSTAQGTADLRAAAEPNPRLFSRVVANGEGSEYLFTLLFEHDAPEGAVAEQMAIVEQELRTVRELCEAGA